MLSSAIALLVLHVDDIMTPIMYNREFRMSLCNQILGAIDTI